MQASSDEGTSPRRVPAIRSLLCPRALGAVLEEALGKPLRSCHLLHRGFSDTYALATEDGDFVFRLYRHGWPTASAIEAEIDLLRHLAGRGMSVATSVPFAGGDDVISLEAAEGLRHGVLFRRLADASFDHHLATLGRLTEELASLTKERDRI